MKFKAMLLGLSVITALPAFAQKPVYLDTGKPIEERVKDALNRMTLEEKVKMIHAQSKFSSAGVPRLGIPEVWATDGPHGIRPEVLWDEWDQAGWTNDSCIAYPALTCLSATWNPEMSHLYGKSIGEEARYRKKDILLGPGVNIYRTPLNGRNFEYMGEDPYLSATMVVPYIKGRHTWATTAYYCEIHPGIISEAMGHSSITVTETYLKPFRSKKIDEANKQVLDFVKRSVIGVSA